MSFFSDLGDNINNALGAGIGVVQGLADVQQSAAAMNQAQAQIASSNAATQLELAKQRAAKDAADRQALLYGAVVFGILIVGFIAVKIWG